MNLNEYGLFHRFMFYTLPSFINIMSERLIHLYTLEHFGSP